MQLTFNLTISTIAVRPKLVQYCSLIARWTSYRKQ